jgi:hypothetical protein
VTVRKPHGVLVEEPLRHPGQRPGFAGGQRSHQADGVEVAVEHLLLDDIGGGRHVLPDRLPGRSVVDRPHVETKTPHERGEHLGRRRLWTHSNIVMA